MPTIPATRLSTPTTIGSALDLCQGFALYPIGTVRAGVSAENMKIPLVNTAVKVGPGSAASVSVRLTCGFYAGICGPAYATNLTVQGSADPTSIALDATDSETFAGLEIGLGLILNYKFDLAGWAVPDISVEDSKELDLIGILIEYFLGKLGDGEEDEAGLPSGASFAARKISFGGLAAAGTVSLRPEFFILINLLQFIPQLKPIIVFLKQVGGSLDIGPTINLVLPVTVRVDKVRTDGHEYTVSGGSSKLTGNRTGPSSAGPAELEVVLTHQSSVEFGFGLGFEFKVLKFFSIAQHTKPIDILKLVKLHTTTSPISNTLQGAFGAQGVAGFRHAAGGGESGYEIHFEDPAPVPA